MKRQNLNHEERIPSSDVNPEMNEACSELDIDKLYDERKKFTIVALTGYTSTGCSSLAKIMCEKDVDRWPNLRIPDLIGFDTNVSSPYSEDIHNVEKGMESVHESLRHNVFNRKYTICYDYIKNHYMPFVRISYTRIVWLYVLDYLINNKAVGNGIELYDNIIQILTDKFYPSREFDPGYAADINFDERRAKVFDELIHKVDWDQLYDEFKDIHSEEPANDENVKLADILISFDGETSKFSLFVDTLKAELPKIDYYSYCFLYHRLSSQTRACGDPTKIYNETRNAKTTAYMYNLVEMIKKVIKGIRHNNKITNCRVVIDRLRNSFEARYLKERYSAFYLIAVHDEHAEVKLLDKLLKLHSEYHPDENHDERLIKRQARNIMTLDKKEASNKDIEKGLFSAPNTEQCVADAEIHITRVDNGDIEKPEDEEKRNGPWMFNSIAEQWLKFAALIQHPGLITPSSEERCMVVAYTAKFNSGCLSRQVGAVITNKSHAIRTIGWNDVPYGQIPCNLRLMTDLCKEDKGGMDYFYSKFETFPKPHYNSEENFQSCVIKDYNPENKSLYTGLKGLPFPYCFKSLHNKYCSDKNQVHTRSLHAEENAILQMAKYGGEALEDGVIYVTASPCELCCKKLYQIGVRKIVYIDDYPGIARENIIEIGYKRPNLKKFQGAYGSTYFKLYQPMMPYKDEIDLRINKPHDLYTQGDMLILLDIVIQKDPELAELKGKKILTKEEYSRIQSKINQLSEMMDRLSKEDKK